LHTLEIEKHPLDPFYPSTSRWLFLGSFPPKRQRWSIDFFYPNFQNDMWRIFGLVFFGDKNHFVDQAGRTFRKDAIVEFLTARHIAIYDMAEEVIRLKDNASDKDLEIIRPLDILGVISRLPDLLNLVTTGQKSTDTLVQQLHLANIDVHYPKVGECVSFAVHDRIIQIYRMPSSSRAYPLSLTNKAAVYSKMFESDASLFIEPKLFL
jgi:G:T/U-mismatch repair DNA glycosylase